jgi:hypothetical protein
VSLGQGNVALVTRRAAHIAANIAESIREAHVSHEMVAQAADIPIDDLETYLQGEVPIPVSTLRDVGGFLRVDTTHLLRGVA